MEPRACCDHLWGHVSAKTGEITFCYNDDEVEQSVFKSSKSVAHVHNVSLPGLSSYESFATEPALGYCFQCPSVGISSALVVRVPVEDHTAADDYLSLLKATVSFTVTG